MGASDLGVSFGETWSNPSPNLFIKFLPTYKFKEKERKKKRKPTNKPQNRTGTESKEVCGKSSLIYICLGLFLDL